MTTKIVDEKAIAAHRELLEAGYREHEKRHAINSANEWFDDNIRYMERQVEELRRYQTRFNAAVEHPDNFCTPANVLSWAVNALVQMVGNYRIDTAVDLATKISKAWRE